MAYYTIGLDLGQANDYSALAVVEHVRVMPPGFTVRRWLNYPDRADYRRPDAIPNFNVVALRRWELGTPYPHVVDDVAASLTRQPYHDEGQLYFDATGVGRAVTDLFWQKYQAGQMSRNIYVAVTITARTKRNMADGLLVPMQQNRVKFARGLALGDVLEKELLSFRQKITAAGHTTYDTNIKDGHGDLVSALQLAMLTPPYGDIRMVDAEDAAP